MSDTGYQIDPSTEPVKPRLEVICAFAVVLNSQGQWMALLGDKAQVEINVQRESTAEDLIPASAAIYADVLASKTAQASLNLQMVVAQQLKSQNDNAQILSKLDLPGNRAARRH